MSAGVVFRPADIRAMARLFGVAVEPHQLRALFAAAGDWFQTDRDMPDGDYYIAGEGMRALTEDERDDAFRFFDDAALMARVNDLMFADESVLGAVLEFDAVNGPCMAAEDLAGPGEFKLELYDLGAQEYLKSLPTRTAKVVESLVVAANRAASKARTHSPHARATAHAAVRPRQRQRRSKRRAVSRAGPGDDSEPAASHARAAVAVLLVLIVAAIGMPMKSTTSAPTANFEAEAATIGACLLAEEAFTAVAATGLEASDFAYARHQIIWTVMTRLRDAGEEITAATVAERIRRGNYLPDGGHAALDMLMSLVAAVPALSNATDYAGVVRVHADARRRQEALRAAPPKVTAVVTRSRERRSAPARTRTSRRFRRAGASSGDDPPGGGDPPAEQGRDTGGASLWGLS